MIDARGTTEADHHIRPKSRHQTPKDGFGEPIAVPESVSGDDDAHPGILTGI
jgi:hypothetical protein